MTADDRLSVKFLSTLKTSWKSETKARDSHDSPLLDSNPYQSQCTGAMITKQWIKLLILARFKKFKLLGYTFWYSSKRIWNLFVCSLLPRVLSVWIYYDYMFKTMIIYDIEWV